MLPFHNYEEIMNKCVAIGAIFVAIPPHCPEVDPIEVCFGLQKQRMRNDVEIINMLKVKPYVEVVEFLLKDFSKTEMRAAMRMAGTYKVSQNKATMKPYSLKASKGEDVK